MTWINSSVFWHLLWVIPVFLLICFWGQYKRKAFLKKIFPGTKQLEIYTNVSSGKRFFRFLLLLLCLLCLFAAMARPAWGTYVLPHATTDSRDLMILFDCSRSMLCDDIKPSRLAHAKWLVRKLILQNPGDRFGLVAFAGNAVLTCPLTVDDIGFLQVLDGLDTDSVGQGGTNIKQALEDAMKHFAGAEGDHKAIILISDGDELTGNAAAALEQLQMLQIPVFAVGIGNPANPGVIRVQDASGNSMTLTDKNGNPVQSPLNEKMLISLAAATNGIYIRSTALDPNLEALEKRIQNLIPKQQDQTLSRTGLIERRTWFLSAALAFLLIFFCVGERCGKSRRKSPVYVFLSTGIVLSGLFLLPSELTAQDTLPPPEDPLPVDTQAAPPPTTPEEWFNAGVEAQAAGDPPDQILQYYTNAINAAAPEVQNNDTTARLVQQNSHLNIGVLFHGRAKEQFTQAEESLKNQNPDQAGNLLEQSRNTLKDAEYHYGNAIQYSIPAEMKKVVKNQKNLLRMRKDIRKLEEDIQKMKELRKQALQQIQNAETQNRQNQAGNQQNRQELEKQIQSAMNTVQELQDVSRELSQEDLQQKAGNAGEALKKSAEENQLKNQENTEKYLKEARELLSDPEQPENQQQNQNGSPQDQEKPNKNKTDHDSGNPDQTAPENHSGSSNSSDKQFPENWDKQQAEALLNAMEQDEKDLKDMLKRLQKQQNRNLTPPEKDW